MNSAEQVIDFLLHEPPLEEIGGSICTLIETYRFGSITKEQATLQLLKDWSCFIQKYIDQDKDIAKNIKR